VTRRLGLHDLLLIRRLQTAGLQLDLKGTVLSPITPLNAALKGVLLPGHGNRVATVVVDNHTGEHYLHGFAQARDRRGRPEQDITFVAPLLSSGNGVIWTWQRLLSKICSRGNARGIQRIFVQIAEDHTAEIGVFRQAGFSVYAKDHVYCRSEVRDLPLVQTPLQWRAMRPPDLWGLHKLKSLVTPAIVQHAEGMATYGSDSEALNVWAATQATDFVLEADDQEIIGHVRLHKGRQGYWLRMILHPNVCDQADSLIQHALSVLGLSDSRLPIYCDVREYEGYAARSLERNGFKEVVTRVLMVKSMTVPIREPRRVMVPSLERQVEHVPTA